MENTIDSLESNREGIKVKSVFREYLEAILWAVVLALVIRTCVLQSFKIPSGSMEDTLLVGDYLLVNKFIYGIQIPFTDLRLPMLRTPRQGDVLVFKYPNDRSKDFIKRVIGVPGDEIQIRNKHVYVNGIPYNNPHEIHKDPRLLTQGVNPRDNLDPIRVPANSYFVMGDNRDNSNDSRFWGFVNKSDLVGLAIIKFWSWDNNAWQVRWQRIGRLIE
jgi:signal peptidase I